MKSLMIAVTATSAMGMALPAAAQVALAEPEHVGAYGELGYSGDTNDSATMNIWLHKAVMEKLAANGGIVPDSLR